MLSEVHMLPGHHYASVTGVDLQPQSKHLRDSVNEDPCLCFDELVPLNDMGWSHMMERD